MNPKALAERWFEEMWNRRKPELIDEMMSPEAVGLCEGGEVRGPADFRRMVYEPFVATFPDMKIGLGLMVAEGEDVIVRWTVTGTQQGAMMHVPPTGRKVRFDGMTWLKVRDGKIIGGADSFNLHGVVDYLATGVATASVRQAE